MINKSIKFCLFLLFTATTTIFAENKVVYLVSPPRSLSVAFLRMMEARKDFKVMNEPSQWAYNKINNPELTKSWFFKDAPQTFDEVKQKIFSFSKESNVFAKEMSFAVKDFILNDKELVENKNVYFVFLIRNPHHSVISWYKKQLEIASDIALFSSLIGFKQTYEIFKNIKNRSANRPLIMLTEDLYNEPNKTVQMFCKYIGIPFKEEAMNWKDLGEDFTGIKEWNEIKPKKFAHHWHLDAIKSTKFSIPTQYAIDKNCKPTFEEISNLEHRECCKKVYEENLEYYKLLLNEKEYLLK
jgi:hypothetical protein